MAENKTNLEVFKHLIKNNSELAALLGEFIQQHTRIKDLSLAKAEDVTVFENTCLTSILESLVALARCAEEDLCTIQGLREGQPKVFGLSGNPVCDCEEMPYQELPEVSENAPQTPKFQVKQQEFYDVKSQCQEMLNKIGNLNQDLEGWQSATANRFRKIQELEKKLLSHELSESSTEHMNSSLQRHRDLEFHLEKLVEESVALIEKNTWMPRLQKLGDGLCNMMSTWRICQALMNVDLMTAVDEKEIFKEFHGMFSKWAAHMHEIRLINERLSSPQTAPKLQRLKSAMESLKKDVGLLNRRILSVSWSLEKQPSPCVLEKDKLNVKVIFFGDLGKYIDPKTSRLAVFTQPDYKFRFEEKHLFKQPPSDGKDEIGATLTFSCVDISKFKNTKRSDNLNIEKFYRFVVDVKFISVDINVECLSMPFTMRSGSGQLWPGTGGVTWYCFTAEDKIFDPTFHHPRNLPVTEVVELIHALVQAKDPEKTFSQKEDTALEKMVTSLHTDIAANKSVGIKQFVMDHMPCQGKTGTKREWSCFAWSIAARNTHKLLMDQVTTGVFNKLEDFVNHIQCTDKLKRAPDCPEGCAFLRLSCNQIDNPAGQDPYAKIIVEVLYKGRGMPCVLNVKELNKFSLPKCLEKFEGKGGEKLIKFVISEDLDIKSFKGQCKVLQPEKDNSCIVDNGYIPVQEQPGAITLLEEKLRLLTTEDTSEDSYAPTSEQSAFKKVKILDPSLLEGSSTPHSSAFDDIPSTSTGIQEAASPMDIEPTIFLNTEQQQEYGDEYKYLNLEPVPSTQRDLDSLLNQCGPQNTKS